MKHTNTLYTNQYYIVLGGIQKTIQDNEMRMKITHDSNYDEKVGESKTSGHINRK